MPEINKKFHQLEAAFLYDPWREDKFAQRTLEEDLEVFISRGSINHDHTAALNFSVAQAYLAQITMSKKNPQEIDFIKAISLMKNAIGTVVTFTNLHGKDALYLSSTLKSHREDLAILYHNLANALYTKSPISAEDKKIAKKYYELALEQITLLNIAPTPTAYTRQWDMLELKANVHHKLALLSEVTSKQGKQAVKTHLEQFIAIASSFVVGRDTEKEEGSFTHGEFLSLVQRDMEMKDKIHTARVMLAQLLPEKSTTVQILNKISEEPMKLLVNTKSEGSLHQNSPSISLPSKTKTSLSNSPEPENLSSPLSEQDHSHRRGFRS